MFIIATKCPPLGAELEVEFALPPFDLVPHPVKLRCVGRVSRVEACYQGGGFAITGQFENELEARTTDRRLIASQLE